MTPSPAVWRLVSFSFSLFPPIPSLPKFPPSDSTPTYSHVYCSPLSSDPLNFTRSLTSLFIVVGIPLISPSRTPDRIRFRTASRLQSVPSPLSIGSSVLLLERTDTNFFVLVVPSIKAKELVFYVSLSLSVALFHFDVPSCCCWWW